MKASYASAATSNTIRGSSRPSRCHAGSAGGGPGKRVESRRAAPLRTGLVRDGSPRNARRDRRCVRARAVHRDDGRPSDEYLALNPWGKIPTLEDGDFVSASRPRSASTWPRSFRTQACAAAGRTRARRALPLAPLALEHGAGDAAPPLLPGPLRRRGREGAADAALTRHFDLIERRLEGRQWLVGDRRTVADFFLFMLTRWGRNLEPASWDYRPNVRAHWLRALDLRGPRTVVEERGCRCRRSRK